MLRFFGLTFALAVPLWVLGASGQRLATGPLSVLPSFLPLAALQALCPLVAALILVARHAGLLGVRTLLSRTIRPSGGRWNIFALLLGALPAAVAYLAMGIQGRLQTEQWPAAEVFVSLVLLYLIAAVSEEGGWTAYAATPMQDRYGVLTASLLLGALEVVFHVVPLLEAGRALGWVAWWAIGTVAQRFLKQWLYNNAASVFVVVIFHATINVSISLSPRNGDPDPAFMTAALAALVLTVFGARGVRPTDWSRIQAAQRAD